MLGRHRVTQIIDENINSIARKHLPVLIGCIRKDEDFRGNLSTLDSVAGHFYGNMHVSYALEDMFTSFRDKYGIQGTPTYLLLHRGNVLETLLGKITTRDLIKRISKSLPAHQRCVGRGNQGRKHLSKMNGEGDLMNRDSTDYLRIKPLLSMVLSNKIIEEIAWRTYLLAFNAAIETSRISDHGKWFAMVAAAVRRLAERSAAAAGEIGNLSEYSDDVFEKADNLLSQVVKDTRKTALLVREIVAASREIEEDAWVHEIDSAVQRINQDVQRYVSAFEEMTSTADEISNHVSKIKEYVASFKIDRKGSGTGTADLAADSPAVRPRRVFLIRDIIHDHASHISNRRRKC